MISLDRVAVPMEEPGDDPVGGPPRGAAKRPVAALAHGVLRDRDDSDASGKADTIR
nr:hypothetical protein [Deltaproteobacteria bacterium]